MNIYFIDALLPFSIGLLLVLKPQIFVKSSKKGRKEFYGRFQKYGYGLMAVGIIFTLVDILRNI